MQIFEDLAPPVTAGNPHAQSSLVSSLFLTQFQVSSLLFTSFSSSQISSFMLKRCSVLTVPICHFVAYISSCLSKGFRKLPLESDGSCFCVTQTFILTHAHRNLCVASFSSSFKPSIFFKWSLLILNWNSRWRGTVVLVTPSFLHFILGSLASL